MPDIEGLPDSDTETNADIRPSTFFDAATVHLLTAAILNQLQSLTSTSRFETRRFRPNLVIGAANNATGFVENNWVGKTLAIDNEVQLKITEPCPHCVMTIMPQEELPKDIEILRNAVKYNSGHIGIYANVLQGGMIRCGDAVAIVAS